MCSISGIINHKGNIEKMIASQRHRAPDEEGVFKDSNIQLGMGRLKIIDLVSSNLSPLEEDDYVLAYNGEIYNYIELRKNLKKLGHDFRTNSDTEVLMKSWREWGLKMFDRLNGMFAFAVYDKLQKQVILGRDIAGEKPLYYFHKGKTFAFASEAKAFKEIIPLEYQPDRFADAFQHCHTATHFKNLYEVPPAHYLIYDINKNKVAIKPYWELKPRKIILKTADQELEELLTDAIKIRTRSDVPYGLYYSGGIDSSLISSLYDFEHRFYFDNTKNWKNDFFKNIKKITWHLDFPIGSLSSYPLWKLAERAQKKVKVVLSGEGADEIFGGYVRYLPVAREWALQKAYQSYTYLFKKYFPSHLDGFTEITARNNDLEFVKAKLEPFFNMFDNPINAMGYADFKLIMPSLLQMGDRMAGAFGIENRCPFLDRRIIEFGFSLPPEFKIQGIEQKIILRRILQKHGILTPLKMEKQGLTITFNKWFKRNDWDRNLYFNLLRRHWKSSFLDKKTEKI